MKSKGKPVICILLLVALTLQLSACGGIETSDKIQSDNLTSHIGTEKMWDYLDTYIVNPDATILTLQCWAPDQYLQTCVQSYNLEHSDIQIKIEAAFENYSDTQSAFAAMDQLNAKLISGDTPDIFCFNSLNIMALENANLVLDLRDFMEKDMDFHYEDYYMNIWEQFALHGHIYEFIPYFEIIGLSGYTSEIGKRNGWSFEEWSDFAKSHTEKNMLALTPAAMLEYMEMFTLSNFVDVENASCDFETESFYQMLDIISNCPTQRNDDQAYLEISRINSLYDYLFTDNRTQKSITGFPSPSGNGPSIQALYSYGICSKTKYPDECWEFLKYLLDEKNAENLSSFSMRKNINETLFELAQLPADDPEALVYECLDEDQNQIPPLSQDEVDYLRNLLETTDTIRFRYSDVENIVSEEVPAYLSGDKTAQDVSAVIQNRVSIFLSEQQ